MQYPTGCSVMLKTDFLPSGFSGWQECSVFYPVCCWHGGLQSLHIGRNLPVGGFDLSESLYRLIPSHYCIFYPWIQIWNIPILPISIQYLCAKMNSHFQCLDPNPAKLWFWIWIWIHTSLLRTSDCIFPVLPLAQITQNTPFPWDLIPVQPKWKLLLEVMGAE